MVDAGFQRARSMTTIRAASCSDAPRIVELLRASLGEDKTPKSLELWKWKHEQSPFGASPVLLALEDDELIGVRAFMRWVWRSETQKFSAVRAVDTATHPKHQGKGVFKKLTLALVDQCTKEGTDFVFNTPNKSSRPGYLKMGWIDVGRLRLGLRPLVLIARKSADFEASFGIRREVLTDFFARSKTEWTTPILSTAMSCEYVSWRYLDNPVVKYFCLRDEESGADYLLFFRLKETRLGVEFRICDLLANPGCNRRLLSKRIRAVAVSAGARFISYSGPIRPFSGLIPLLPVGPIVTARSLASEAGKLSLASWRPSIGDMELF